MGQKGCFFHWIYRILLESTIRSVESELFWSPLDKEILYHLLLIKSRHGFKKSSRFNVGLIIPLCLCLISEQHKTRFLTNQCGFYELRRSPKAHSQVFFLTLQLCEGCKRLALNPRLLTMEAADAGNPLKAWGASGWEGWEKTCRKNVNILRTMVWANLLNI